MSTFKRIMLSGGLLLTGCAQLQIDVDVYRGQVPTPAAAVEAVSLAAVASASPTAVATVKSRIFNDARAGVAKQLRAAGRPDEDISLAWTGKADDPRSGINVRLTEAWQPIESAANALYADAKRNLASPAPVRSLGPLRGAQSELERAWTSFRQQVDTALNVALDADDLLRLRASIVENPFDVPGIAASDTVAGRFAGSPIFDPRIGSLSQDARDWARFGTNSFNASGGTSQFVVVREGLLVYHQKSLDFDPTPVIGAGAAVTKLGLKVGAALATGVLPAVAASAPTTTTSTTIPTTQAMPNADALERDRELLARNRGAREQLLGSLATLLDQANQATAAAQLDSLKKLLRSELNFFLGRTARGANQ